MTVVGGCAREHHAQVCWQLVEMREQFRPVAFGANVIFTFEPALIEMLSAATVIFSERVFAFAATATTRP